MVEGVREVCGASVTARGGCEAAGACGGCDAAGACGGCEAAGAWAMATPVIMVTNGTSLMPAQSRPSDAMRFT